MTHEITHRALDDVELTETGTLVDDTLSIELESLPVGAHGLLLTLSDAEGFEISDYLTFVVEDLDLDNDGFDPVQGTGAPISDALILLQPTV